MERAIKPLEEYVRTFANFVEEANLNPDDVIQKIEQAPETEHWSELKIRDDIYVHQEKEKELLRRIPEHITVSMFKISCNDIRNQYAEKYRKIVEGEINLIAARAKQRNAQLTLDFREFTQKVTMQPRDIDHLNEIKNDIDACGVLIKKKKAEIDDCMAIYKILEEFHYQFTKGEQDAKWDLFGAPQRLVKVIEAQSNILEKEKERMTKQMEVDQEEFEEAIGGMQSTVVAYWEKNNVSKFMEYFEEVDSYDKKIKQLIEQGRVYNQREMIVGKEQKDYSALQKMSKDFLPFYTLWTTVKQWKTDYNSWMTGRWEDLKADQLVTSFEICLKNMAQSVRFFGQDTDEARLKYKELLPIAKTIKEAIDEFKPVVPLAEALRKDGMVERHWDELSAKVGFDIHPDENFTLTTVINLGMKNHVAVAEEIGEKAFKEFHIEKSLRSMKAAWEN